MHHSTRGESAVLFTGLARALSLASRDLVSHACRRPNLPHCRSVLTCAAGCCASQEAMAYEFARTKAARDHKQSGKNNNPFAGMEGGTLHYDDPRDYEA
jgi:hypothetical protein